MPNRVSRLLSAVFGSRATRGQLPAVTEPASPPPSLERGPASVSAESEAGTTVAVDAGHSAPLPRGAAFQQTLSQVQQALSEDDGVMVLTNPFVVLVADKILMPTPQQAVRAAEDATFLAEPLGLAPDDPRIAVVQAKLRQALTEGTSDQVQRNEDDVDALFDADWRTVDNALVEFFNAHPWEAKLPILKRNEDLLLSDTALLLARSHIGRAETEQNEARVNGLSLHWAILRRARQLGVESGWNEYAGFRQAAESKVSNSLAGSPVEKTLLAWLKLPSSHDKYHFLEAHLELLASEIENRLMGLIFQNGGRDQVEDDLRTALHLLRSVRARGEPLESAIRDACVDAYNSFALDVPGWLEEMYQRVRELLGSPRLDQTAAPRVALLRDAIARSHGDARIAPEVVAGLRTELARAILQAPRVAGADAIDESIAATEIALGTFTAARFPRSYAVNQHNLGMAYRVRSTGNRRDNLETAIEALQKALRIRTLEYFPYDYAQTQTGLGVVYIERTAGEHYWNVEHAITAFQEALRVYTPDEYPFDYAQTLGNLGVAYRQRIGGERSQNVEEAIKAHQRGLGIHTFDRFPVQYAMAQVNLGCAYGERIAGVRSQNIEHAITAFREALRVFTPDRFPFDYATTQESLGNAFRDRVEGVKRRNLENGIAAYQEALRVYTLADFPIEHRDTNLQLAWLAADELAVEARKQGDKTAEREAYELAHEAFQAAQRAQTELGWLEIYEQGDTSRSGQWYGVQGMYVRDAWCLYQLGDLRGAVAALETGRAQSLAEAQSAVGVSLQHICSTHAAEFRASREALQRARASGDFSLMRAARDAFLDIRTRIRAHCDESFLPSELTYEIVQKAAAPGQALIYVATTDFGGMALVVPPGGGIRSGAESSPVAVLLSALTPQVEDGWLIRTDTKRRVVGGWLLALSNWSAALLTDRIYVAGEDANAQWSELAHVRALPLRDVAGALPEEMVTLRQAFERLIQAWREEADLDSGGNVKQQATAKALRARLILPLSEVLKSRALVGELDWYFQEAELDALLPQLRDGVMQPLREALDRLGLDGENQQIALVPCGMLGALPLHAAEVREARGRTLPFQETCELTYQASARSLATAREALARLPKRGSFHAIGNPQPTMAAPLGWAEAEADAIVSLAIKLGLAESAALLNVEATREAVLKMLRRIRDGQPGAWIEIAGHGRANFADPHDCYMLLAHDDRLTLADLQRNRLLENVRCFIASGCNTGLNALGTAPDELGSFLGGVLESGAAGAIATQWSVNDRATFLLMLRFAQIVLGDPNITPARALREAAKWLRTAKRRDLEEMARKGMARVKPLPEGSREAELVRRDALRGISTRELAADADTAADSAQVDDDAAPDGTRLDAGQAFDALKYTLARDRSKEHPFDHPIYWACAVAFGA